MVCVSRPDVRVSTDPPAGGSVRVVVVALASVFLLLGLVGFAVLHFGGGTPPGEAYGAVGDPAPSPAGAPAAPRAGEQGASRSGSRFQVDPAWVTRTAAVTGIPAPAMRAYADAELRLDAEQPDCRVGWNTLAGIGWIESHHGTIGDRTLRSDGWSSTTILGPALNGAGDFAAIRSTPSSAAWHDDATWEHAVGPLQFLASTWDRWGADGDGDGAADPRDLDDAALTAGRYLCADGHDLGSDSGWSAAVHSYNHDMTYVANVASVANTYAARVAGR